MKSLVDAFLPILVVAGILTGIYYLGRKDEAKQCRPSPIVQQRMLYECSERLTECQDTLREYGIKEK